MGQTIQVRRGNQANLPTLNNGEPAFTTDTKDLYMGTPTGNVLIGGQSISSQLAQNAKKTDFISVTDAPYKVKTDGTNSPSEIQAVINAAPWYSTIYFPVGTFNIDGLVISKPLFLLGASMQGTVLLNSSVGVDAITFNNNNDNWGIENLTIRGNGSFAQKGADATSGNGIVLDTAWVGNIHKVISQLHGQNGLYFKNSSWTVFVENSKFELNKLDGVRGYGWGGSQINSIRFLKCRAGNNNRSGYNLWGTSISITQGTAEGNKQYGIEFNSDNQTNVFTSRGISIRDVHLEENQQGSLYFKVSASTARVIQGLTIDGVNIDHTNDTVGRETWSNQAVIFAGGTNDRVSARGFRRVYWGINSVSQKRVTSLGAIDFGGNFASDSSIHLLHPQDQLSYLYAYLNMGAATKIGTKKRTISGYSLAKGTITFSDYKSLSDHIATSGSIAVFPLQAKDGEWLFEYGLKVTTDSTNYSVIARIYKSNEDGSETQLATKTITGSGNQTLTHQPDIVLTGDYPHYLRVTVTYFDTPTTFKINNPYVITNG